MELYYKIRMFAEFGIPIILFGIAIIMMIVLMINGWFNKKFKKNCFKCKYYELFDVPSAGGKCKYRCNKYDRMDYHSMNSNAKYMKCKEYEEK